MSGTDEPPANTADVIADADRWPTMFRQVTDDATPAVGFIEAVPGVSG